MNVLITRPERDAAELKAQIEGMGHTVLSAPLIDIELLPFDASALAGAAAIIVTSRNALRALAAAQGLEGLRNIDVFAVGSATADMARGLGFTNVIEGIGTGEHLADMIAEHLDPHGGPLVHLSGDHLAFDMTEALTPLDYRISRILAYRSIVAKSLPAESLAALENGTLDAVVLMSPLTAKTWARIATNHAPLSDLARITHICLSPKVAAALPAPLSAAALIANNPKKDEIIALLYRLAAGAKNR